MIQERHARDAVDLDAKCYRAWRRWGSFTEAARRLNVTSKFLRAAVERAEAAGVVVEDWNAKIHRPTTPKPIDDGVTSAEEYAWLLEVVRHERTVEDVAVEAGVTPARVLVGLNRVRRSGTAWWEVRTWNPRVEVMIPVDYRPSSPCPHVGPLPKGKAVYCVVCHASGLDGRRELQIDPKTAPKPDPKPPEPTPSKSDPKRPGETRRERRAREHAAPSVAAPGPTNESRPCDSP